MNFSKFAILPLLLFSNLLSTKSSSSKEYNLFPHSYYKNHYEKDADENSLLANIKKTPVTFFLIATNIVISLIGFNNNTFKKKYRLNTTSFYNNPKDNWYTCITAGFLHLDSWHLFTNMFLMWLYRGAEQAYVERWGSYKSRFLYVILYLGSILGGSMSYLLKYKPVNHVVYTMVGASLGVYGLAVADLLASPTKKVCGIPRWISHLLFHFIITYVVADKILNRKIAHIAHLGGALFSILFNLIFDTSLRKNFYNYLFNPVNKKRKKEKYRKARSC